MNQTDKIFWLKLCLQLAAPFCFKIGEGHTGLSQLAQMVEHLLHKNFSSSGMHSSPHTAGFFHARSFNFAIMHDFEFLKNLSIF